MAILLYLQAKEGPTIGHRKIMYHYWKDYGLLELEEQHLACQVRSILKTGKQSEVELEGLKRQIKKLHGDNVESETGELDEAEEEFVTQSDDNVLLQELTAGASGNVEDTGVNESESKSDITKWLKRLLKNPKNDPIPSLRFADTFRLKQETKAMSSITLNDISDFKNLIKAGVTIICERMRIRKSAKPQQEPIWKRRTENDIAKLRKGLSHLDTWFKGKWEKEKKKKEELRKKYRIKAKGFKALIEELKQRIFAKSEKLRRYRARGNQYKKKNFFDATKKHCIKS